MQSKSHIGQYSWLEAGKVSEEHPAPGGEEHILCLYVTMTDSFVVALFQYLEQLEHNPLLLHHSKEWSGTVRCVHVCLYMLDIVFMHNICTYVCFSTACVVVYVLVCVGVGVGEKF